MLESNGRQLEWSVVLVHEAVWFGLGGDDGWDLFGWQA